MEKDPNEIGALWLKSGPKGNPYLSGVVNGQRIVVFKNGKKKSDKAPDYRILLAKPREAADEPKQPPAEEGFHL